MASDPITTSRRALYPVRRAWKRKFAPLRDRLEWFHWERRERSYMLIVFGVAHHGR